MLDTDWLNMSILIFVFVFSFLLGEHKHPAFFVVSGVIGLVFAFNLYTLVPNLVLALVIVAISIMIIVYGIVKRPTAGIPEE